MSYNIISYYNKMGNAIPADHSENQLEKPGSFIEKIF